LPAAQVQRAQRSLLDDPTAKSHLSLRELVDIMIPTFVAARDSVTRYDAVMAELTPILKSADTRIEALKARASTLGAQAASEVERVRAIFAETRRRALDDPLGVESDVEQVLQEPLRALDRRLTDIEQERASMHDALARAQARQARAVRTPAQDPVQAADLGDWLSTIARTLESGEDAAARVGLQRWSESADQVYGREEQRREQLDLLKALRAMAQRRREQGAVVDANLDAVGLEAEAALRHPPVDLERASQLVQRYQQGVTAL
jgi:hypothetical protein